MEQKRIKADCNPDCKTEFWKPSILDMQKQIQLELHPQRSKKVGHVRTSPTEVAEALKSLFNQSWSTWKMPLSFDDAIKTIEVINVGFSMQSNQIGQWNKHKTHRKHSHKIKNLN